MSAASKLSPLTEIEVSSGRLRVAACNFAASRLRNDPVKQELQAKDELYKAAIAYAKAVAASKGKGARRVGQESR